MSNLHLCQILHPAILHTHCKITLSKSEIIIPHNPKTSLSFQQPETAIHKSSNYQFYFYPKISSNTKATVQRNKTIFKINTSYISAHTNNANDTALKMFLEHNYRFLLLLTRRCSSSQHFVIAKCRFLSNKKI